MAIIRKKKFTEAGDIPDNNIDLIDTPDKLLAFADSKRICLIPLEVEKVAAELGIQVESVPLKGDLSGILYKDENKNCWIIQVNEKHHPNRQRYTVAHELGHFCLHKHYKKFFEDQVFFRGGETTKEEWQANDFASVILMPEDEFREKIKSGIAEIDKLSEIFQVSTLALRIRAKNLGMSGHGL